MTLGRRSLVGTALLFSVIGGGVLAAAGPAAACDRCGHYGSSCDFRRDRYGYRPYQRDYAPRFSRRVYYSETRYAPYRGWHGDRYPRYRPCDDDDD